MARRARIDRRDNNTPRAFSQRTFLQVFGLSALAGAFLLVQGGASLLVIGSIPLDPAHPLPQARKSPDPPLLLHPPKPNTQMP